MEEKKNSIIGREESRDLGISDWIWRRGDVKICELEKKVKEFLKNMQSLIDNVPKLEGEFQLDTIEIPDSIEFSGKL